MTPKLHTNKHIKDGVQAAVGESHEPAHIERVVKVDACATVIGWRTHVSQHLQKDDHVVRHPAEEEHGHDGED